MGASQSKEKASKSSSAQKNKIDTVRQSSEKALAWPGRNDVDPRAPYKFDTHLGCIFGPDQQDMELRGDYREVYRKLHFFRLVHGKWHDMPETATYPRQAWKVGVAVNTFRIVPQSVDSIGQKMGHWGIYISPKAAPPESASYMIFGMNFGGPKVKGLILEDIWGTPGADGTGEWKKTVSRKEFTPVTEKGLEEKTMFFSLEEFVLFLQWQLHLFITRKAMDWSNPRNKIAYYPGSAYSLLRANCQHFARQVIDAMKTAEWEREVRLKWPFDLQELKHKIAGDIAFENKKWPHRREQVKETYSLWSRQLDLVPLPFAPP